MNTLDLNRSIMSDIAGDHLLVSIAPILTSVLSHTSCTAVPGGHRKGLVWSIRGGAPTRNPGRRGILVLPPLLVAPTLPPWPLPLPLPLPLTLPLPSPLPWLLPCCCAAPKPKAGWDCCIPNPVGVGGAPNAVCMKQERKICYAFTYKRNTVL